MALFRAGFVGQGRLLAAVVALVWLLWTPIATAAAPRVAAPAGWLAGERVQASAARRAESWAAAAGAQIGQVFSAPDDDGFAETLAVLDLDGPLAEDAFADATVAGALLESVAEKTLGRDATAVDVELSAPLADGARVVRGRVELDDTTYHVALAPWGSQHSLIVLASMTAEVSLYRPVFAEALRTISGVGRPVWPFSNLRYLGAVAIAWLALGVVGLALVSGLADRSADRGPNARKTAVLLLLAAVVAVPVAYMALEPKVPELTLAGLDRAWVAGETGLVGVLFAAGAWALSRRHRADVIRSAPAGGVYAGVPTAPPEEAAGRRPTPIPREVSTSELKLDQESDAELEPVEHDTGPQ